MSIDPINEIQKAVYEKRKLFSDMCSDAFGNGEKMSAKLAEFGVDASPPTCRSWINLDSAPNMIKEHAVLAVIDILDEQRIAEIRARQSRVRSL